MLDRSLESGLLWLMDGDLVSPYGVVYVIRQCNLDGMVGPLNSEISIKQAEENVEVTVTNTNVQFPNYERRGGSIWCIQIDLIPPIPHGLFSWMVGSYIAPEGSVHNCMQWSSTKLPFILGR